MLTIENLPNSPFPIIYLPKESRSSRNVHGKSRGACRPSVIVNGYEVMCESGLERKVATVLATDPDVLDLQEQPPAVTWFDAEGNAHRHTFDFLATLRSGVRIAIPVKLLSEVKRLNFQATIDLMAPQLPRSFADAIKLITEEFLPLDIVHNADLLKQSLRTSNPDHDELIKKLVGERRGATIGQIVEISRLEGFAFQAISRLIARGSVRVINNARISYLARVELIRSSVNEENA
ncbi:hypothetical protein [Bosea sp. (in: a-proteobacteria)]|uniref:hypothetical protein n=1 Tax=Bosea sp. (in: a-proteobacteria) TaxID=1871050 RepID=UPI0027357F9F|nr:hypothetical protein [Bosea sp. (in: a-proteobacteria)]MDP3256714.1 hypothetical protein [Bosea sp. (in: a-proteobacteria)]